MWCDGYDLDLFALVPEARAALAPAHGIILYTHGGTFEGTLNHPSCWSGPRGASICFFGFASPEKPDFFYTWDPVVRCTWEQVTRDLWDHQLTMLLHGEPLWNAERLEQSFTRLMDHTRGYHSLPDHQVAHIRARVVANLRGATHRLLDAHARWQRHQPGTRLAA